MLQDNYLYTNEPYELETTRFNPKVRVRPQLNIKVYSPRCQFRGQVESFILDKLQHHHSATIREFMPLLIDLDYESAKNAVVGIRPGVNRPFF
jgi:hypothetical protein